MSSDDKKMRLFPLCVGGLFLALTTLCVLLFCRGPFTEKQIGDVTAVFNGWIYGREDQKKADAALLSAGLSSFEWKSGRLLVPGEQKDKYQAVLSASGAFPRAPSESRGDALRQMSPFESEAKTKMRELDGCALQLERTIEQMNGIEYVTVGVRSRREQVGLSSKNLVTASIGVAYEEGRHLDKKNISAITVVAKRMLGIDDDRNVAILDLKEGVSYIGSETNDSLNTDESMSCVKARIENYWREKYLKAFADISNFRVSVDVDVVASDDSEKSDCSSNSKNSQQAFDENNRRLFLKNRDNHIALASSEVYVNPISDNVRSGGAKLGNPSRNGRSTIGESFKSKTRRPKVLEDAIGTVDIIAAHDLSSVPVWQSYSVDETPISVRSSSPRFVFTGMQSEKSLTGLGESSNSRLSCSHRLMERKGRSVSSRILQVSALENKNKKSNVLDESLSWCSGYALRTITFHLCLPRSFILSAARQYDDNDLSKTTFAEVGNQKERLLTSIQEHLIEETKDYAVSLFLPTAERLGWSFEEVEQCFIVDVYADVNSFAGDFAYLRENDNQAFSNFGSFETDDEQPVDVNKSENFNTQVQDEKKWTPVSKDELFDSSDKEQPEDLLPSVSVKAPFSGKFSELAVLDEGESVIEPISDVPSGERLGIQQILSLVRDKKNLVLITSVTSSLFLVVLFISVIYWRRRTNSLKRRIECKESENTSFAEQLRNDVKIQSGRSVKSSYREQDTDWGLRNTINKLERNSSYQSELDGRNLVDGDHSRQREVLELISRYPEKAVASLQGWVNNAE